MLQKRHDSVLNLKFNLTPCDRANMNTIAVERTTSAVPVRENTYNKQCTECKTTPSLRKRTQTTKRRQVH